MSLPLAFLKYIFQIYMYMAIVPFDTCSTYNHCIFFFFNQNITSCLNHFDHKVVDFQAKNKIALLLFF
jgi:hypothetical protein